ncbi:MAG TPA: tetratricopeptide repeat protein [Spirochaetes bacterium]|nr:tetratricopeptide repeat protein [Spirochaetota bacterium]
MDKKEQHLPYFKNLLTAAKDFYLKHGKILLYTGVVLPLVISILVYFAINKREGFRDDSIDYLNRDLIEGINHYRLENYERARILLKRASVGSNRKKMDSIAFLYLGNIEYKGGNYSGAIEYFQESLSYDKKNVFALFNSAQSYMKMGDPELTLENVLKIYKLQKEYAPNLLLLGNIYYAARKYEKALSIYEGHENVDGVFRINAAAAYLNLDRPEDAANLLSRVIEDPDSEESLKGVSYFTLSSILGESDPIRAVRYLRAALNVFPSNPVLRYNLALLLMKQKKYRESVDLLRSVDRTLKEEDVDTLLGMALFKSENLAEALDLYLDMFERTGDTSIAHIIGDIYIKLGELREAEKYYIKALQNPENEGAFRNLVNIYIKEKRYSEAVDLSEELISSAPDGPMPYICLADVYFNIERKPEGRELVEKAVLLAGEDLRYLSMAAELYQENELNNNALQLYHRMLSLEPGNYIPYMEIAEIYMKTGHTDKTRDFLVNAKNIVDHTGQYYRLSLFQAEVENDQKAFDLYHELVRDFPYRYEAYFNLSLKYIEAGRYESAIRTVQKCLESDIKLDFSALSDLYTILGVAQHYSGNSREAAKAYKESLRLDKNNEFSFLNLRVLD